MRNLHNMSNRCYCSIHPRSHTFPNSHYSALNIIWAYVFKKKKKKKISCINKTYISVISTCAVSRAAPSFRTCACWPTVMEHSDCCYKTLYHWFLSSPFPFVHLYSFDTRWHSLARRPVFPICNIFCKFTILTPTKRRASGGELRVSRRTRVECF